MKFKLGFELELLQPHEHWELEKILSKFNSKIDVVDDCSVKRCKNNKKLIPTEIITPPLPEKSSLFLLESLFDYFKSIGAVTNKTCGLHINLSIDGNFRKVNPNIIVASTDDYYIAKVYNRENNQYCEPWKDIVKQLNKRVNLYNKTAKSYNPFKLKSEFESLTRYISTNDYFSDDTPANSLLDNLEAKYTSINLSKMCDSYIEYRMIGGENYLDNLDVVKEAVDHFKIGQSLAYSNIDQGRVDRYLEWAVS